MSRVPRTELAEECRVTRRNLSALGWTLTREQVAKLDAASATTLTYPYWHQRGFTERNPSPAS